MALPLLTVWYNTRCPVCDAGIDATRNRLLRAARSGAIAFRDINLEPDALARYGAGLETVRRSLHGVTTDKAGREHLLTGADCAIAIWRRTPGREWLGWLLGLPGCRQIARIGYEHLADRLYAWNRRHGRW
jgi:predicted DCC family thiol-disulfide oxidoreductase YuxK